MSAHDRRELKRLHNKVTDEYIHKLEQELSQMRAALERIADKSEKAQFETGGLVRGEMQNVYRIAIGALYTPSREEGRGT